MQKYYIYVAGPYSGGDQSENVRDAVWYGKRLLQHGYVPFVPHICHLWNLITPLPYETWLEYDEAWIEKCDALLRIPGKSPGADREVEKAKKLGIPIFYSTLDLFDALPTRTV